VSARTPSAERAGSWSSWRWLAVGLALRIALTPFQHTWDSQTWWNVATQLGREPDVWNAVNAPYEHMRQLSALAHGSGFREFYEYWAYPPGMLLVWWPVARAWFFLAGPMAERFAGPDSFTAMPIPLLLALGMKAPIILADAITVLILGRLGHPGAARWYWLNPYVLLVGLWTFDPIMVALLLSGVLAAQNQRWAVAGVMLGCGAAVKFVPALLVPVVVLCAWRAASHPVRSAMLAAISATAAFGAVCAPWADGVLYVLQFHATRAGGGVSWQSVWGAIGWVDPFMDLTVVHLFLSPQIGALTLSGCVLIATWLAWLRGLDLLRTSLVVLLAYLAGSKLVNEAYPLPALALAAAVVGSGGSVGSARLVRFLWVVPLVFALLNVPVWGFALAPAEVLGWIDMPSARLYQAGYLVTYQYVAVALAILGTGFQIGCIVAVWSLVRPIGRVEVERALGSVF